MNSNISDLYQLFYKIKNMGWIKSMRKGSGGIGYTFETLIGKDEDTLPLPDFENIEIKTIRKNSKKNIHLFSLNPDGDDKLYINRIINRLGYPDKEYKQFKVLNVDFNGKRYTNIGHYRPNKVKLIVDRCNQKIILIAKDHLGKDLEIKTSWSFELIRNRIFQKLNRLAIIEANSKIINNEEYFSYESINYYLFKDFDTFIKLIEDGIITIEIKIGIYKNEKRLGQIRNRGAIFSIKLSDIGKLYKEINITRAQD